MTSNSAAPSATARANFRPDRTAAAGHHDPSCADESAEPGEIGFDGGAEQQILDLDRRQRRSAVELDGLQAR
jgi:hypothetical protein